MMVFLCVFIGACEQNSSQSSDGEDNHTLEMENLPGYEPEACCENMDPPNATVDEVLPATENEAEQITNENTESEEE